MKKSEWRRLLLKGAGRYAFPIAGCRTTGPLLDSLEAAEIGLTDEELVLLK